MDTAMDGRQIQNQILSKETYTLDAPMGGRALIMSLSNTLSLLEWALLTTGPDKLRQCAQS